MRQLFILISCTMIINVVSSLWAFAPVRNIGELRCVLKTKVVVLPQNHGGRPPLVVSKPHKFPWNDTGASFIGQQSFAIVQRTGKDVVPRHPAKTHGGIAHASGN